MKVFNMIFVIGIALISSISTITAVPDAVAGYPNILSGDLSFVNHTSSEICDSGSSCGWIFYKNDDERIVLSFARIACLCPQNEQCTHLEEKLTYIHNYKCAEKTSNSNVKTTIETME